MPNPASRPEFLAHPRLRRTSPITHYVVAAALEATAALRANRDPGLRLGLVVCLQSGCVNYSCRFFDETLKDPATASPLLFPGNGLRRTRQPSRGGAGKCFAGQLAGGRSGRFSPGSFPGRPMAGRESCGCVPRHRRGRNQLDSGRRALASRTSGHSHRRRRGLVFVP